MSRAGGRKRIGLLSILLVLASRPAPATQLYWLDSDYAAPRLTRVYPDGFQPVSIALPANTMPQAVALDSTNQTVYWTQLSFINAHVEHASADLSSYSPPGSGPTPYSCLRGIAVDPLAHQLYLTSTNLQTGASILRVNEDGTGLTTLLSFPVNSPGEPHDIALDLAHGFMYWCDLGRGTITRATLAGGQRTDLASGFPGVSGLALDLGHQRLYFTDWFLGSIWSMNLDGSGLANLGPAAYPVGIAVDPYAGKIYWSESGVPRLRSANLDGSGVTTIAVTVRAPTGVLVIGSPAAGVASGGAPQGDFALSEPAPNPALSGAGFRFSLPRAGAVRLGVFDVQGREVARLLDGVLSAGSHAGSWSGRAGGAPVPPGVYFLRCAWEGKAITRRIAWIH